MKYDDAELLASPQNQQNEPININNVVRAIPTNQIKDNHLTIQCIMPRPASVIIINWSAHICLNTKQEWVTN